MVFNNERLTRIVTALLVTDHDDKWLTRIVTCDCQVFVSEINYDETHVGKVRAVWK